MSLGREIVAATIGRPRFREYPGPPTCAILFLPFAALAAFGFLTFRAQLSPGFYWFVAFCAALMLAGALITFAIWLRFGVTISLHELGVVLNGQEMPFAGIESVTVRDKRRFDETATVKALTRTILIEGAGRKVKALYVAKPGEALDHILDHIAERVAAEPRPRAGKGWRVEQGTLHARGTMVPLSTISAAGIFERDVRLWRHRDEAHFLSVPYDSKNARVLLALASNRAVEAIAEPSSSESGIGRLLFARRTTIASVLGNTILVAFGLALAWLCVDRFLPQLQTLGNGAILGLAALWILHAIYRTSARYDFHERAVVRHTLLGIRTLAYADIHAMTWRETVTVFEHVIPMGTTVHASLFPAGDAAPLKIVLHRFRGADGDLEPVRTSIARPHRRPPPRAPRPRPGSAVDVQGPIHPRRHRPPQTPHPLRRAHRHPLRRRLLHVLPRHLAQTPGPPPRRRHQLLPRPGAVRDAGGAAGHRARGSVVVSV
ncbi:MAG TPA: hypothetical protein VF432_02980 [Thermoanaerobaculia bacterium]